MHAMGRSATGVMGPIVLSLLAGCGTWNVVERQVSVELAPAGQSPLAVRSDNGSIQLGLGTGEKIVVNAVIRARTQERADAAQIVANLAPDGRYLIEATWPSPRMSNEGCSFVIATPPVTAVDLSTSNGAISLTGLSGTAELDTSNGSIKVSGFTGPIHASTSNGAVTIVGASGEVRSDSSNGRISVEFADGSTGPATLDTSNGSIELVVGSGFTGSLSARTSNGSVTIGAPGAKNVQVSKGHGAATFGEGAGVTTLTTSNGSITVRAR